MSKRYRMVQAKPGELKVAFGREVGNDPCLIYAWGPGTNKAGLIEMMDAIEGSGFGKYREGGLRQKLETLGYDITTLKFSVQRKKAAA